MLKVRDVNLYSTWTKSLSNIYAEVYLEYNHLLSKDLEWLVVFIVDSNVYKYGIAVLKSYKEIPLSKQFYVSNRQRHNLAKTVFEMIDIITKYNADYLQDEIEVYFTSSCSEKFFLKKCSNCKEYILKENLKNLIKIFMGGK